MLFPVNALIFLCPQQVFEWGGLKDKQVKMSQLARGVLGYAPPENLDFNSSQMPRNAFKINQRNP